MLMMPDSDSASAERYDPYANVIRMVNSRTADSLMSIYFRISAEVNPKKEPQRMDNELSFKKSTTMLRIVAASKLVSSATVTTCRLTA